MLIKKQKQKQIGFTLVETLVAVAILLTAIAGPMSIAHQGAVLGRYSRDQMIASYLAQDGLEYVRYVIATNSNNDVANATGLANCVSPTGCIIDTFNGGVPVVYSGQALSWDSTNRVFVYGAGDTTRFKRKITVDDTGTGPGSLGNLPNNDTEFLVTVTVTWNDGADEVVISDLLVDWRVVF